jgi:hypothetical protein
MKYVKSFEDYSAEVWSDKKRISEAEAYDEPADPPKTSFRQEDWSAKDNLKHITNLSEEIILFVEDGEQLEESQLKLIKRMFDDINMLKRQLEGREKVKMEEEKDRYENIDNPNL